MFWCSLVCSSSSCSSLSSQIWGHGTKDHHGEDLRLRLFSERGFGHRSARSRHRLQLQPNLPPEPESREETSAEGDDTELALCLNHRTSTKLAAEWSQFHTSAAGWEENMFVHVCVYGRLLKLEVKTKLTGLSWTFYPHVSAETTRLFTAADLIERNKHVN